MNFFGGRVHSLSSVFLILILLNPLLILLPAYVLPVEAVDFSSESETSRMYLGKTLRHDDPNDPDTTCNIISDDHGGVLDNNKLVFGQEDDFRCYKSVMQWDVSSWDLNGVTDFELNYTDDGSYSAVIDDPQNNLAEIHATVSSTPCLASGFLTNTHFNSIDSSWTLLKTGWTPVTSSGASGTVSLTPLTSILTSASGYLCLSFSQAGTDVGTDANTHRNWQLSTSSVNLNMIKSSSGSARSDTSLSLAGPSAINLYDTITFIGRLTDNVTGAGISGALITIQGLDDNANTYITLGSGSTDSGGNYNIAWTSTRFGNDLYLEIYAVFAGNSEYFPSTSATYSFLIDNTDTYTQTSDGGIVYIGKTIKHDNPESDNIICNIISDDHGGSLPASAFNNQLQFGKSDSYRCYKSVFQWDISSWDLSDLSNIYLHYADGDTYSSVFNDLSNNNAEIHAKVSSTPCMSNGTPSTIYFNAIDTTWTLVKSNWVPFTASGESDNVSLSSLGSLLSSGGTYLCLSFSQHGTDVGSDGNSHWVIKSSLSIAFTAPDEPDEPDEPIDEDDNTVFTTDSPGARMYNGKTLRHDDPNDPDTDCNIWASDDNGGVADNNKLVFGQEDDFRCYRSVMQWDVSSWDLNGVADFELNYTDSGSYSAVIDDPQNNLAEIHATVSSTPCLASGSLSDSYFNSIDSSWTLLKTDWVPVTSSGASGTVSLTPLTSILTSSSDNPRYLCLSFTQAGTDVGTDANTHRNWQLSTSSVNLNIIRTASFTNIPTQLSLSSNQTQVQVGEDIIFSGQLTRSNGQGISGSRTLSLREYSGDANRSLLAFLINYPSDNSGSFTVTWNAESQYLNHCKNGNTDPCILEFFVEFEGNTNGTDVFEPSTSAMLEVTLTPIPTVDCSTVHCSTNLTLGANWQGGFLLANVNSSGSVANSVPVTFIGQLTHNGSGIPNQIITIFDWDSDNVSDTLATTTTLADGSFSVIWNAECKDDGETPCRLELFAEFVGNATSPDPGYGSVSTSSNSTAPFHFLTITSKMSTSFGSMSISNGTPPVGESVTISAHLRRSHDQASLSNMNIEFIAVLGTQTFTIGTSSTDSNGFAVVNWIPSTSGVTLIRAQFTGNSEYTNSSISMTIQVQSSQEFETTLVLDPPPSEIGINSTLIFTGRLTRNDNGAGISNQMITIFESDGSTSQFLTSGSTDNNGLFYIPWNVQFMDSDLTIEIYSQFDGNITLDATFLSSISNPIYAINIFETTTSDTPVSDIDNAIVFIGKTIKHDNPESDNIICNIISDDHGGSLPISSMGDQLSFGKSDAYRCYKSVFQWDISSWDLSDLFNVKLSYTDGSTYSSVFNDLSNNNAEIHAKVSSTPCLDSSSNPTSTYFNEIDTTWNLVKSNWVPFTASDGSDEISLTPLASLLSSANGYLCLSFSQAGTDVGSSMNSHWMIKSLNIKLVYSTASTSSVSTILILDQPINSIVEGDSITFTGNLIRSNDTKGIPFQQIFLFDNNDQLLSVVTNADGDFQVSWTVNDLTNDNLIILNARFNGDNSYSSSESLTHYITILPYVPQAPLTPASPIAWQSFISTLQSNVGEECDDFASAIPETALSFGQTDNYRCYIAVAMWDLSSITAGLQLDDINDIKLTYRGSAPSHCQSGNANCDQDPDPAEIRYVISQSKCYSGFENHNTDYWRSTENWGILESNWTPLNSIYNSAETSISIDSLRNQLNDGNYLCLAFSQSGTNEFLMSGIHHSYWRIDDLSFEIETTPTVLTLDVPVSSVSFGESITFSGRLLDANNDEGVSGMLITIFESDSDDGNCFFDCSRSSLATGFTQSDGSFSIVWQSAYCEDEFEQVLDNCFLEVYAEFSSTVSHSSSSSLIHSIQIITNYDTNIVLDTPISIIDAGGFVTFTGRLTNSHNSQGIGNMEIKIFDNDGGFGDDLLQTGLTDSNGYFTIVWTAEDLDILDNTVEVYALFSASGMFKQSQSQIFIIEVLTPLASTEITLNELPNTVSPGQIITLSGFLRNSDTGEGLSNQLIYILEYDSPYIFDLEGDSADTIMFNGLTNSDGSFSFDWTVPDTCNDLNEDPCTFEIYSYFEGNSQYEKSWLLPSYHQTQLSITIETSIVLDGFPEQINSGDEIVFTGRLIRTDTGVGIPDVQVLIINSNNELLISGLTDQNGYYTMSWTAQTNLNTYFDISATVIQDGDLLSSTSDSRTITIVQRYTPPTLLNIFHSPNTPILGDEVTIYVDIISENQGVFYTALEIYLDDELIKLIELSPGSYDVVVDVETLIGFESATHTYSVIAKCGRFVQGIAGIPDGVVFVDCEDESLSISDPTQGSKSFVVNELELNSVILTLDLPILSVVNDCGLPFPLRCTPEGSLITFIGMLTASDGNPLEGMNIDLFDRDGDHYLSSVITNSEGIYEIAWESYCPKSENPCFVTFETRFAGTQDFESTCSNNLAQTPANICTSWNSTSGYTVEIYFGTLDIAGSIFCEGIHCLNSAPGQVTTHPIQFAQVWLIAQDFKKMIGPITTDSEGRYSFENVSRTDSSGEPLVYSIHVILDDGQYVRIIPPEFTSGNFAFTKIQFLGSFASDQSVPSSIPIIFSNVTEQNAASTYSYAQQVFEFMIVDLEQTHIIDYPTFNILVTAPIDPENTNAAAYFSPTDYVSYPSPDCFGEISPSDDPVYLFNGCYLGMRAISLPSQSAYWKDAITHEILHALDWANGGYLGYNSNMRWQGGSVFTYQFLENLATGLSSAITFEIANNNGVSLFSDWTNGMTMPCNMMDVSPLYLELWMEGDELQGGFFMYEGFRYATDLEDHNGLYCTLSFIIYDFWDHPGVLDWWDSWPGPPAGWVTINGEDVFDYTDTENVNVPLKVLWESLSKTNDMSDLEDVFDLFKSLDLDGDGIAGTENDELLANEVFTLHKVPGGVVQV